MQAVEVSDVDMRQQRCEIIQAADVDAGGIRVEARVAEGVDAAVAAEPVFGGMGAELVQAQCLATGQQAESLGRHAVVQRPLLAADRAVALDGPVHIGVDLKTHGAAVAASLIGRHGSPLYDIAPDSQAALMSYFLQG